MVIDIPIGGNYVPHRQQRALDNALQKHSLPQAAKNTLEHESRMRLTQFRGIHKPCMARPNFEYAAADVFTMACSACACGASI